MILIFGLISPSAGRNRIKRGARWPYTRLSRYWIGPKMIKCHFSNFWQKNHLHSLNNSTGFATWFLQITTHKVIQSCAGTFLSARKLFSAEIWKMTWKKKHSVRSTTTRHFDGFFGVMKESNVPHRFSVKILAYDDDDYYDSEWLSFWSFEDCIKDHIQITISDEIKCFGWDKILFRPVIYFWDIAEKCLWDLFSSFLFFKIKLQEIWLNSIDTQLC